MTNLNPPEWADLASAEADLEQGLFQAVADVAPPALVGLYHAWAKETIYQGDMLRSVVELEQDVYKWTAEKKQVEAQLRLGATGANATERDTTYHLALAASGTWQELATRLNFLKADMERMHGRLAASRARVALYSRLAGAQPHTGEIHE